MGTAFAVVFLVYLRLLCVGKVACTINPPKDFIGTEGETAYFRWNSSIDIVQVKWGLYDKTDDDAKPFYINVIVGERVIPNYPVLNGSRYEGRVQYIGNIAQGHAWFSLSNIAINDTGVYAAAITEGPLSAGKSSKTTKVTLTVKERGALYKPVVFQFTNFPSQDPFCRGDSTTFTCNATAKPPAEYSLYRNNQLVQRSMNGQFVVQLDVKGANTFTCVPNNTVGIGANKTIQFFVTDPPSIVVSPQNVTLAEGHNLTLFCNASGDPAPNIIWSKVGGKIVGHGDTFTIGSVVRGHEGSYRCVVNNGPECDPDSALAYVTVNSPPSTVGLSIGAIIGIVVGVIAAVLLCIIIVVVVVKKSKNDGNQIDKHNALPLKTDKEGQEGRTQPEA